MNLINYQEDTIGKKEVVEIIDKFLEDKRFDGFENFYGMHQDTDNIHCHLLINSVNSVTGKKWHLDDRKKDFLDMEIKLNKIAIDYGCKVPDKIAKILKIQQEKKINTKKTVEEKKEYEPYLIRNGEKLFSYNDDIEEDDEEYDMDEYDSEEEDPYYWETYIEDNTVENDMDLYEDPIEDDTEKNIADFRKK